VWAVVGGVHDDRVLGDAELVEQAEQITDEVIVIEHRVVILRLPAPGAANAFGFGVGAEMHVGGVEPDEERGLRIVLAADEIHGGVAELLVDGLHPLLGQRAGVLDALGAIGLAHVCSTPRGRTSPGTPGPWDSRAARVPLRR
jgi:hypothetical protein